MPFTGIKKDKGIWYFLTKWCVKVCYSFILNVLLLNAILRNSVMSFMFTFFGSIINVCHLLVWPFHRFFFQDLRKLTWIQCIVEIDDNIPHNTCIIYRVSVYLVCCTCCVFCRCILMCRSKFVVKSWNKIYLNTGVYIVWCLFFIYFIFWFMKL